MYTPPHQGTPRSHAASDDEEEDDDEFAHDADLGFGGPDLSVVSIVGVTTTTTTSSASAGSNTTTNNNHTNNNNNNNESPETAVRSPSTTTTISPSGDTPTRMVAAAAAGTQSSSSSSSVQLVEDLNAVVIVSAPNLDAWYKTYREVAHTSAAVSWELSSSKPGNGVEQLRDPSTDTYWQSDGTTQPHWVQITFRRRLPIVFVALYLDCQLDESYTPKTLSIETGMTTQDLTASPANTKMELTDPSGWSVIAISGPPDPLTMDTTIKAHMIRINILAMHQNGRDTHIRRLAIFAKRTGSTSRNTTTTTVTPLRQQQLNIHHNNDDDEEDDDDDDTNLMLNSEFGGPMSMLIR